MLRKDPDLAATCKNVFSVLSSTDCVATSSLLCIRALKLGIKIYNSCKIMSYNYLCMYFTCSRAVNSFSIAHTIRGFSCLASE